MYQPKIAVPQGHAYHGVRTVLRKYKEGGYNDLIDASIDTYRRTQKLDPLFAPGIRFIVDAALAGLEHFDATSLGKNQKEVRMRAEAAASYAVAMNEFALESGLRKGGHRGVFTRLYLGHAGMNAAMTEAFDNDIGDVEDTLERQPAYLGDQGRSVFTEVSPAAGGAVNFLKEQNSEMDGETIRNIVIASDELRQIGNIPKDWVGAIHNDLETPYIDTRHYELKGSGTVTFNTEIREHLRELRATEEGSGCPANYIMYSVDETRINAMREGWRDAASFIVTPDATTHLRYRET